MDKKEHKATLMQLQVGLPVKILASVAIMTVLIVFVYYFNIPNPNMILIAGLVLCSAMFGFGGGIVAAVIMFFYTLFFFSTDNSFIEFTPQNLQKVGVSLVGILVDMLLVCFLKRAEVQAFNKVADLSEQLRLENEHLHNISLFDPLTGIKNRLALRQDFDSYCGHEVTVMMIDIDKFKQINDTRGHAEGDRILKESGADISETFGREYSYRYGGDEFLVILPDESEEGFKEKLDALMSRRPVAEVDGAKTAVGFSAGFVNEKLDDPKKLRDLFAMADERMYQMKQSHGLAARA
jgi:diguanylate cyclase (GGDEF)-like protein